MKREIKPSKTYEIGREKLNEFNEVILKFYDSSFKFDANLVFDMHFTAVRGKYAKTFNASDGFIELLPEAGKIIGTEEDEWGEEYPYKTLLQKLKTGADMCSITLTSRDNHLYIDLPCSPLADCKDNIIEYSNCPSFERQNSGNLRICAGQLSKTSVREKIIFNDVIKNWDKVLGKDYCPDVICGSVAKLHLSKEGLAIEYFMHTPKSYGSDVEFFFQDYIIHTFDVSLGLEYEDIVEVERMLNGHIYVRFRECGICLECTKISVYHYID